MENNTLFLSEDAFFTEGFEGNFVEGNGGVLGAAKGWARVGRGCQTRGLSCQQLFYGLSRVVLAVFICMYIVVYTGNIYIYM